MHGTACTHDLAKTLPFPREEITTKFSREAVDADDTVPVELYSRPYERLELEPDSRPYERIEITRDADAVDQAPSSSLRLALAIAILCWAFALGITLAFLVL